MSDFDMGEDDFEQMYQEVILEASKHPHGKESFAADLAREDAGAKTGEMTVRASRSGTGRSKDRKVQPAQQVQDSC